MPGPNIANQLPAFGGTLKAAREAAGLTQAALARQASVSSQLISMMERDEVRDPHVSSVVALARALTLTLDAFLGLSAEQPACRSASRHGSAEP